MGEWHTHLGEPLYYEYEENDDMHKMTADQLAQLEDVALRIKAEQNPKEPKHARDNMALYQCFMERLKFAEAKHPVFAEGPYEALGFIGQEFGEIAAEITKRHDPSRWFDEALDLLVVTWRFARGDWKQGDEE